jgi:hypothetical protein
MCFGLPVICCLWLIQSMYHTTEPKERYIDLAGLGILLSRYLMQLLPLSGPGLQDPQVGASVCQVT